MDRNVSTPDLLRRILVRAGFGIWRQRGSVLLAAIVTSAAIGYVTIDNPSAASTALAQPAPISATADCANTVIAAVEKSSPVTVQQAYQCMTPAVQQQMTETAFGQKLATISVPGATRITRLGTYQGNTGNTLVYFAVDANAQTVGYMVYVGPDGKVLQIQ